MRKKLLIRLILTILISFTGLSNLVTAQTPRAMTTKSPKPDLKITSFTAYYGTVSTNQNNKFTATIKNIGTVKSPACKKMIQRGGSKEYSDLPAIEPGQYVTVTFYAKFSIPQKYHVSIMADARENITEIYENNNFKSLFFDVIEGDKPNLYIKSMSFGEIVILNKYVNLTFQVMNNPGGSVAGPSKCTIKIGGESVGKEYLIPTLNPGQGHTFSRGWTPTALGDFVIKAIADSGENVNESDEFNLRKKTIKVINDGSVGLEKRALHVTGSVKVRISPNSRKLRQNIFHLYYSKLYGLRADDLEVLVDNKIVPASPGYPGHYNNHSIPYNFKGIATVKIRKKIPLNPPVYQDLVIASGKMTPVQIKSPPKGYVFDVDSGQDLVVSWSKSTDEFHIRIKELGNDYIVVSGNSYTFPSSSFNKNQEYNIAILQYMENLDLTGSNVTQNSVICNITIYNLKFTTK